ncbi:MAG TPA: hypothetical protein VK034_22055 [Enhygromyxa sp.]|nr:hypothetical protein [Enhygromyxa sp.]
MSSSDEIDLDAKLPGALGTEAAAEIASAAGIEGPSAVDGPAEAAANRAIAEGLASGALDPVAAQQLLIDQVLAEQLPPDIAPEQLERLRGELAALLQGDPALLGLLSGS